MGQSRRRKLPLALRLLSQIFRFQLGSLQQVKNEAKPNTLSFSQYKREATE